MFFIFNGMSLIYYIKNDMPTQINEIYYYFKIFLLFIILVPIIMNAITLYLLVKIERKSEISIHKLFPIILDRYINYLIKVGNNEELLSYYKGRCKAELAFYVIILIFKAFIKKHYFVIIYNNINNCYINKNNDGLLI